MQLFLLLELMLYQLRKPDSDQRNGLVKEIVENLKISIG